MDDGDRGRIPALLAEFGKTVGWGIGGIAGILTVLTLWGWLSDNTSLLCSAGLLWMGFLYTGVMLLKTVEEGLKSIARGVAYLEPVIGGTGVDVLQAAVHLVAAPGALVMGLLISAMEAVPDAHTVLALWSHPGARFDVGSVVTFALPAVIGWLAERYGGSETNRTWLWRWTQMLGTFSLCRGVPVLLCGYSGKEALYQANGLLTDWMTVYPGFQLVAWPLGQWRAVDLYRAVGPDSFWVLFCLAPLFAVVSYEIMAKLRADDPIWDSTMMYAVWASGFFTLPIGVFVLFKEVGIFWGTVIGATGFFFWQTVRVLVTTLKVIAVLIGIALALFVAFQAYDRWRPVTPSQPELPKQEAPVPKRAPRRVKKSKAVPKQEAPRPESTPPMVEP